MRLVVDSAGSDRDGLTERQLSEASIHVRHRRIVQVQDIKRSEEELRAHPKYAVADP